VSLSKANKQDLALESTRMLCRTLRYVCTRIIDNFKHSNQLTRTEGFTAVAVLPFAFSHFPFGSTAVLLNTVHFLR
jgi:hypothetical protein